MSEHLPPEYYKPEVEFLFNLKQRLECDLDGIDRRLDLLLGGVAVERQLTLVVDNTQPDGPPTAA